MDGSSTVYALMYRHWPVHWSRAHLHETNSEPYASSPSPSPPNNRRGTIIPLLLSKPQDSPLRTRLDPAPTTLYLASSHNPPTRTLWLRYVQRPQPTAHSPEPRAQSPEPRAQSPPCLLRNASYLIPVHMLTASSKLPTSRAPTPATTSPTAALPRAPCLVLSRWTPTAAA
jgi:hypothetical protein